MRSILILLATLAVSLAEEPAVAFDGGKGSGAERVPANVQVYLEKLKSAHEQRDRELDQRKQHLSKRLADLEHELDLAKRAALISDYRKRYPDGSVMINDGRTVTMLTERLVTDVRLSFCDQVHKDRFISQHTAEIEAIAADIQRIDSEKKTPVIIALDFKSLAVGDIGEIDPSGGLDADVVKIMAKTDLIASLRLAQVPKPTVWISDYSTDGIKEGMAIRLRGRFEIIGKRQNSSPDSARTLFELRPFDASRYDRE